MNFYILIPAHNEEAYIAKTLQSLAEQTLLPKKIVVVNDASADGTQRIIDVFSNKYSFIEGIFHNSEKIHEPGSKVINAFYKGYETLNKSFDIICKFDADLIFPNNYLEKIAEIFNQNPKCGIAGGFCYIEKDGNWVLENLTNKDHVRGALKAYRKECFLQINGLKSTMGWDTVDELLAQYNGWEIITASSLHVKHLKPTGKVYSKAAKYKQGEAFYKMRYGFALTAIASAKLAFRKKSIPFFINYMKGFFNSKKTDTPFVVSEKEGEYIRELRWKNIRQKLGFH